MIIIMIWDIHMCPPARRPKPNSLNSRHLGPRTSSTSYLNLLRPVRATTLHQPGRPEIGDTISPRQRGPGRHNRFSRS